MTERRCKQGCRSWVAAVVVTLVALAAEPCRAEPQRSGASEPTPVALPDSLSNSAGARGGMLRGGSAVQEAPLATKPAAKEVPKAAAGATPQKDSQSAPNDSAFEFYLGEAGMKLKAFPKELWVFLAFVIGAWVLFKAYLAIRRKPDPTARFTRWIQGGLVLALVFASFGFGASAVRDHETWVPPARDPSASASPEDVRALAAQCVSVAARAQPCCPPVVVTLPTGTATDAASPPAASPQPDAKTKSDGEDQTKSKEPLAEVAKDYFPPEEVRRGADVSIPVSGMADSAVAVILSDVRGAPSSSHARLDHSNVIFSVPGSLSAGRYRMTIRYGEHELVVPGELRVAADEKVAPVIKELPTTVYPKNGSYSFTIIGEHFGDARETSVFIGAHDPIQASTPCDDHTRAPCLKVKPNSIDVQGFQPSPFEGLTHLSVKVVNNSSAPIDLTFSMISVDAARLLAVLATTLILVAIYYGVRQGVGWYRVGSAKYDPLQNFILDRDTNSYSLSKLQVLLWTGAAMFAYLYLFVCRILIQWRPDLPDVPDGMSTLVGLSVATTIVAGGVTATRGPKGAGPHSPTAADFVTSGGIVVPERFQFLVWTIVGVMSFVGLVLASDPSHLAVLPTIPQNFLALMGISAAGYLAGKSIRTQGPVIHRVSPEEVDGKLVLKIEGLNFEANPTVRIDQKEYPNTAFAVTKKSGTGDRYTLIEWSSNWSTELDAPKHLLEVANSDGQTAAREFTIKELKVEFTPPSPPILDAGNALQTLSVSVTGSVGALEAEWTAPGATSIVKAEVSERPGTASIKLMPGTQQGVGQLAVIDTMGQRAVLQVRVRAAEATPAAPAQAEPSSAP